MSVLWSGKWTPAALGMQGDRFARYANKYPSDLLKGEPDLKQRLHALLGANYGFFMERLQTEVPIEVIQGTLIGKGCKAHECTVEEAVLFITLADGKLHCAIRSDTYRSKVKTFSENPSRFPSDALKHALEN
jgi:hypothetical protein